MVKVHIYIGEYDFFQQFLVIDYFTISFYIFITYLNFLIDFFKYTFSFAFGIVIKFFTTNCKFQL